jgi:hypothetical protein
MGDRVRLALVEADKVAHVTILAYFQVCAGQQQ